MQLIAKTFLLFWKEQQLVIPKLSLIWLGIVFNYRKFTYTAQWEQSLKKHWLFLESFEWNDNYNQVRLNWSENYFDVNGKVICRSAEGDGPVAECEGPSVCTSQRFWSCLVMILVVWVSCVKLNCFLMCAHWEDLQKVVLTVAYCTVVLRNSVCHCITNVILNTNSRNSFEPCSKTIAFGRCQRYLFYYIFLLY